MTKKFLQLTSKSVLFPIRNKGLNSLVDFFFDDSLGDSLRFVMKEITSLAYSNVALSPTS